MIPLQAREMLLPDSATVRGPLEAPEGEDGDDLDDDEDYGEHEHDDEYDQEHDGAPSLGLV